jgi:hypothetical protein
MRNRDARRIQEIGVGPYFFDPAIWDCSPTCDPKKKIPQKGLITSFEEGLARRIK